MEGLTFECLISQTHEQNIPAHCQEALLMQVYYTKVMNTNKAAH